jgi:hypothetical protein
MSISTSFRVHILGRKVSYKQELDKIMSQNRMILIQKKKVKMQMISQKNKKCTSEIKTKAILDYDKNS